MSRLSDIGEDALIARLISKAPCDPAPGGGPGDDCAVIEYPDDRGRLELLKTDALVCNVHYTLESPPKQVGWKAVARVVSDFAAMGGRPERFLVTLALPPETEVAWAEALYDGIGEALRVFDARLAGGETSRVPKGSSAVISIAATGSVSREALVLRSTGKPGDVLMVTGRLGGSIAHKHLHFTPRIKESDWLVSNFKPTAMMDISDGLAKDLPRLAEASACGFELDFEALPRGEGCGVDQALTDGEDYELLFAMAPERVAELQAAWAKRFPDLELTVIGRLVEEGKGITLSGGWDHFAGLPDA
ncbi:MAG: thiamine-phosphate kinase [Verrucomicrobia bacterium]|nr:thiamine-phosphate kinase [Verrucomicrobiota bacterium]